MIEAPLPGHTTTSPLCFVAWPPPAGPFHRRSTLPFQWTFGGHGPLGGGPPPVGGFGGSWLSDASMNTSYEPPGGMAGTLNAPIKPSSGKNAPNAWAWSVPSIGDESCVGPGFDQRTWNRTVLVPASVCQSIRLGCGFAPVGLQLHVVAHSSTMPGWPAQSKRSAKQHVVGIGVVAMAETQIQPCQFGGTGFGAGVTWSWL